MKIFRKIQICPQTKDERECLPRSQWLIIPAYVSPIVGHMHLLKNMTWVGVQMRVYFGLGSAQHHCITSQDCASFFYICILHHKPPGKYDT